MTSRTSSPLRGCADQRFGTLPETWTLPNTFVPSGFVTVARMSAPQPLHPLLTRTSPEELTVIAEWAEFHAILGWGSSAIPLESRASADNRHDEPSSIDGMELGEMTTDFAGFSEPATETAPVAAAAITPTMAATGSNTAFLDLMFMGNSFLTGKGIGTGIMVQISGIFALSAPGSKKKVHAHQEHRPDDRSKGAPGASATLAGECRAKLRTARRKV